MDITFKTPEGRFNLRVCAILIHENRILAMKDERSPYYYLPGGRVALHETAEEALSREMREELEMEPRILRPLWLNQSFFTEDVSGEQYHELCTYFLVEVPDSLLARGDRFTMKEGNHTHWFHWLPLDSLEKEYFYPIFLKEAIFHLPDTFTLRTERE